MTDQDSIYRLLFEHSAQGMVLRQGEKIVLANQSFADMVGYRIDELLAFSVDDSLGLIHPEDRAAVQARFADLLRGADLHYNHTYRFLRRNGDTGWWSATVTRVEFDGQPAVLGVYEDVTERKDAQDAVARGQNLLASTLNVLPVGVCLTDETGHYRMMNDAYCAIYEYKRDEMLGQHYSVIMPPDQVALANAHYARLLSGDVGIPVERKRQRKDGSIVYIEAANALVQGVDGQKMVITTVRDITERKRAEEIVRLRLGLLEYAATHSTDALMQKALDEISELTGSPISFYHFVAEDQETLTLMAWSTRTLAEFCRAEGQGRHYPIAQAGVWADCAREKRAIIHNDYASLPNRKGLPEGHAELVRELVVPTLRDDKVVAILGVGNKRSDYTQQDAELVSYIADVVWSILEQKRADVQIRELNARLERLAMIDELTDLPNRRAFFAEGAVQISKARRQRASFSLLVLDFDDFKRINDTYGHAAGDVVLKRFGQVLAANIRATDLAARLGGEEFGVLLPNTDLEAALQLAERIRAAVEQEAFQVQDRTIRASVSIGAAAYRKGASDLEAVIKLADDCMYRAKNGGRNRVVGAC